VSKTRASIAGTQVEVHIGHMAQVIGVRALVAVVSKQLTDLSPFAPTSDSPDRPKPAASAPEIAYARRRRRSAVLPRAITSWPRVTATSTLSAPRHSAVAVDLTARAVGHAAHRARQRRERSLHPVGVSTMAGIEAGIRTIRSGSPVTVDNDGGRATSSTITLPIGACVVV
jgi:hypothetical protein